MDSVTQKFHGAWRFVSSIQTLADGTTRPNPGYGLHGVGNIIYTPQGRMMVFIMDPSRAPWAFDAHPTEPELRAATKGFLAYGGRYEVHAGENAAEGYVLHHVDLEPSPNRVGKTLQRFYTFAESENGTRLILRAAPPLPAGVVEYAITWERLPDLATCVERSCDTVPRAAP
ncbi:MAG: hypothetical protein EXQ56_05415 [Acidobacteria bacterium]|nr:hypothetical protein [Acidobacteriota bacterium]